MSDSQLLIAKLTRLRDLLRKTAVPKADAILTNALLATGHGAGWLSGSLSDEQRREVLEAVVTEGKAWFRAEAEAMLEDVGDGGEKALFGAARAKVGAFFARAKKHVRELFTAGVLAVTGPGPANQTDAIVQATQQQVAEQVEYLDRFHQQVVSEEKPLNQAIASRAEMYADAAWPACLEIERQGIVAEGKATEVLRVLDENENHCNRCPALAELGWVKMKDAVKLGVVPLGKTPCRVRCRCYLRYR